MKKFILAVQAMLFLAVTPVYAEKIKVKFHKEIDLRTFKCTSLKSVLMPRACYDKVNHYMVIKVGGDYYHYCEIDSRTVASLTRARSIDDYFYTKIKGQFDCRKHKIPEYKAD